MPQTRRGVDESAKRVPPLQDRRSEGHRRAASSRDHVLAVLGVKTVGDSEPIKKETPKGPKEDHPENLKLNKLKQILDVGARNEQKWPFRKEDKAQSKKDKIEVAKEVQDSLKVSQDTANKMVNNTDSPENIQPGDGNNSANSYIFGIVIFCAAIYFVTYT